MKGTQFLSVVSFTPITAFILVTTFLPIFHNLQVVSINDDDVSDDSICAAFMILNDDNTECEMKYLTKLITLIKIDLQLPTSFHYLELRFSRQLRLIAAAFSAAQVKNIFFRPHRFSIFLAADMIFCQSDLY